jgi:hypothetical protein
MIHLSFKLFFLIKIIKMKNIKVKSYSLKKNQTKDLFNNFLQTERKITESKITEMPNEVDKILKSPSLNISSKLDSKGNRMININFFDSNKNFLKSKESASNNFASEGKKAETEREKNINIKLNINSEVINNNIKIGNSNQNNTLRNSSESGINTNNSSTIGDKNTDINKIKTALSHYRDLVSEKDKEIENLKNEILKLKQSKLSNTSLSNMETSPIVTIKPSIPGFKLDFKNKLNLNEGAGEPFITSNNKMEICSERTSNNTSNYSKQVFDGGNKDLIRNNNLKFSTKKNDSSHTNPSSFNAKDTSSNAITVNNKNKKLNSSYNNFFRKSNTNVFNSQVHTNKTSFVNDVKDSKRDIYESPSTCKHIIT